jgi:hypothetical protein
LRIAALQIDDDLARLGEINTPKAWSLITAILKVTTGQLGVLLKDADADVKRNRGMQPLFLFRQEPLYRTAVALGEVRGFDSRGVMHTTSITSLRAFGKGPVSLLYKSLPHEGLFF